MAIGVTTVQVSLGSCRLKVSKRTPAPRCSRRFTRLPGPHPESQRPTGWIARTRSSPVRRALFGRRYASAGFSGQPGGQSARELPSGRGHDRKARSRTPHGTGDGARDVQARLLPQTTPHLKTPECAGRCRQARSVGGDYYDFLDLGPGQIGLVLADVSRK